MNRVNRELVQLRTESHKDRRELGPLCIVPSGAVWVVLFFLRWRQQQMPSFPVSLWAQFRAVLPPTFLAEPASDTKDQHARDYVARFAAQCAFSLGSQWGAKNAGGGRPLSKDVVAVQEGGRLYGFDMFSGLGENVTTVNPNPGAADITGQTFVPVAPQDFVGGISQPGPGGPVVSGNTVVFTSSDARGPRYLTAEDGGGEQGKTVGNRPAGLATAGRDQAAIDQFGLGWQTWTVEPADGGVAFKVGDFYATCWETGGKMIFNRRAVGPGEVWRIQQVDGGVAVQGYTDKFLCVERDAQGNITGEINVNRDSPGPWETLQTIGLSGGVVVGGETGAVAFPVALDGKFFRVPIVGASFLYAVMPGLNYGPALDEVKGLGFNAVRTFLGQLDQVGQTVDGGLYQRIDRLARDTHDRGLTFYACYITNAQAGYDLTKHVDTVESILRPYPHVLKEIANEADHATQGGRLDKATLQRLRDRVQGICTLSADIRDGDTSTRLAGDFYAFHLDRGQSVERLAMLAGVRDAVGKAGSNQEPIGADEINQPGKRSNDPALFQRMGELNRQYGFAGFFHSEAGLNARTFGPVQRQCAEAFLRGSFSS